MYNIIDNSSIRINRDVNTNNTCYLYVSEIRYHSLPNLNDLWPADASKIGDKKVMKTNPYPSILHYFFSHISKKGVVNILKRGGGVVIFIGRQVI